MFVDVIDEADDDDADADEDEVVLCSNMLIVVTIMFAHSAILGGPNGPQNCWKTFAPATWTIMSEKNLSKTGHIERRISASHFDSWSFCVDRRPYIICVYQQL